MITETLNELEKIRTELSECEKLAKEIINLKSASYLEHAVLIGEKIGFLKASETSLVNQLDLLIHVKNLNKKNP